MKTNRTGLLVLFVSLLTGAVPAFAEPWPALPETNAAVMLPAQEWPLAPGPREVKVLVHFPRGRLENITAETGLLLSLHNWGGTDCVGTAAPQALADQLNVVAMCVNYLQSGRPSIDGPEPYDFGYLQSLDALRAMWWLWQGLKDAERPFDDRRIYATGGSGGGNVSLMCNKLAPRTFAAIVDINGMKKLSDDVAFNLPGGSDLDARYRRDPLHPYFLSPGAQELRFIGCPEHLGEMRRLGAQATVFVIHGRDDRTCPFAEAEEFVRLFDRWMSPLGDHANPGRPGPSIEPRFIGQGDLDGVVFTGTGHGLGDRTKCVMHVAGERLKPGANCLRRSGPTDFQRREAIHYRTSDGRYVISYERGYPLSQFEPKGRPTKYQERLDLSYYLDSDGQRREIRSPADWAVRRAQLIAGLEATMGPLPSPTLRGYAGVSKRQPMQFQDIYGERIEFESAPGQNVPAYVLFPPRPGDEKDEGTLRPAVLCLHQTTNSGKDEPAGRAGDANLAYALELARRGYFTLVPDYPSFGEHPFEFGPASGYASGSMKAVWDNMAAVDVLEHWPGVDGARIGCIGHSLGGHNALFTAAFDTRLKVIVSSCGFCTFTKDDVPSWTGPRYMPLLAQLFGNDAGRIPWDFSELVASLAPRPFFASVARGDDDFDVTGVEDAMKSANGVYELFGAASGLVTHAFDGPHSFPPEAREKAYEFLDRYLAEE